MFHGNVSPEIARGLLALKDRIDAANIPSSKIDETLNLATWNIREFGKKKRTEAAIHYIAEIIGQFDLVSVIELRENLEDLQRVLTILGPYWRAVYSGVVQDDGGNGERVGFIYDKRAVVFNGMAATAIPARQKVGEEYLPEKFWWRPPYLASFRAGNFDFVVLAAHIRWATTASRITELNMLAAWIDTFSKDKDVVDKDLLVVGDFNVESLASDTFRALASRGLQLPASLAREVLGSNLEKNKRYDQILHLPNPLYPQSFMNSGGVLDFHVEDSRMNELFPKGITKAKYTRELSDHLPLWVQIRTDDDRARLEQRIQG